MCSFLFCSREGISTGGIMLHLGPKHPQVQSVSVMCAAVFMIYEINFSIIISKPSWWLFPHGELRKVAAWPNNEEKRDPQQRLSHPNALHLLDQRGRRERERQRANEKFKMISISDRGKPFDNRICGRINRLTDELMNNTQTDFISEIDSSSNQCSSHLPWCESAGIAILNRSTSTAVSRETCSSV